jgi:iron complex outermembrane receptor protein
MTIRAFRTMTSVLGLCSIAAFSPGAIAQEAGASEAQPTVGQEIVVTAQRRSELSRDVPITVTTLSQTQLATANVNTLADTSKLTPGLRFDAAGSFVQPTIRGVGTAVSTSGGGPNVGIYVDGFFQSNPEVSDFQLMKVENIQVLKGPQGTLFGRNTTGGAILVTTADPSTEPAAEFKAQYGRFNEVTLQGYATAGMTDKVAFDIEGLYRRGDGYMDNVGTGDNHPGKYENWSIRTGMKAEVSDAVSVLLRYTHAQMNDPTNLLTNSYVDKSGEAGFFSQVSPTGQAIYQNFFGVSNSKGLPLANLAVLPPAYPTDLPQLISSGVLPADWPASRSPVSVKPGEITSLAPPSFTNRSDSAQGTIKADLGFADLTSYTQYRKDTSNNIEDLDATAGRFFDIFIGIKDETFSQEFLFNSKSGSKLQWTAGLNYYTNKDDWSNIQSSFVGLPFAPFGGSYTKSTSYAAFADFTYEFNPKLFLTVGGRYSHDVVSDAYFKTNFTTESYIGPDGQVIPFNGALGTVIPVDDLKNNKFTPRAVLRYKPSDESSVYASYTAGYKAGILNVGGLSQLPVKPEDIDAFELGYKFDNHKFGVDLAGFYYDYKNLQVSSFQSGAAEIRNAASSEIYGIEGAVRYSVDSHLDLKAGLAWTHARYKSFTNAPFYSYCDPVAPNTSALFCSQGIGGIAQTTVDASGFKMQRSPDVTANFAANYGFDLGGGRMNLSGNLYYTSKFYFDPEQQFSQDGYALLSLRAQWVDPSQHYTIAVFGDNVTDKRYQTQVLFNTTGIGSVWSKPATYGVEVGAKF